MPTGSNSWICTGAVLARRQFFGHHVLGALVQLQHFARALDHASGSPASRATSMP